MNCSAALEAMLDAELSDIMGGSGALATHVSGCGRCRRVAGALKADTQLLATRPWAVAGRRSLVHRYALVPVAAVVAVLLLMVPVRREVAAPPMTVATLAAVVVDSFPAAPAAATAPVNRAPRTGRAYPRAVPIAAVRLASSQPLVTRPATHRVTTHAVTISPPAGSRAVVMQTGDPKLVVVWLY